MKIGFMGECMSELRDAGNGLLSQSFAGDVYNSAVYLKRTFSNCEVSFVSAVGSDKLSVALLEHAKTESINTQLVGQASDRTVGQYQIHTDEHGERSFTYWRSASAAKAMMTLIDDASFESMKQLDALLFSGITLAVLEKDTLEKFWTLLESLKAAGVKLIFDMNYRPALWQSKDEAKALFSKSFEFADVLLPGVEDFAVLYGIDTADAVIEYLAPYSLEELIIKDGPNTVNTVDKEGVRQQISLTPVTNVVDTTSAGDAFNGAYLGARANDLSIAAAVKVASQCAAFVIQHKGAIVDSSSYEEFCSSTLNLDA